MERVVNSALTLQLVEEGWPAIERIFHKTKIKETLHS
ncbi:hypothetical protein PBL1C_25 [Paenibacillus phage PBL1c]|uniref:Uncharacterized protein n=1 Tax=Paenibacillus phage PBL1c TaxID=2070194 RepID=A0A2I7SC62_9CAUD|nr:hypothetical protein HWB44_gp25 [Paenibacillus phage PBL1c]AUS03498.1 hypothetical protein PBL1C_25 [Paenibacillus phage PBL1c]